MRQQWCLHALVEGHIPNTHEYNICMCLEWWALIACLCTARQRCTDCTYDERKTQTLGLNHYNRTNYEAMQGWVDQPWMPIYS